MSRYETICTSRWLFNWWAKLLIFIWEFTNGFFFVFGKFRLIQIEFQPQNCWNMVESFKFFEFKLKLQNHSEFWSAFDTFYTHISTIPLRVIDTFVLYIFNLDTSLIRNPKQRSKLLIQASEKNSISMRLWHIQRETHTHTHIQK